MWQVRFLPATPLVGLEGTTWEFIRMQDGDIQGPGELLGWDDLAADDQDTAGTDNSVSAH